MGRIWEKYDINIIWTVIYSAVLLCASQLFFNIQYNKLVFFFSLLIPVMVWMDISKKFDTSETPLPIFLIPLLPVLVGLPGMILSGFKYSYFSNLEFAQAFALSAWSWFNFYSFKRKTDISFIEVPALILLFLFSLLGILDVERVLYPNLTRGFFQDRTFTTFGNPNVYACFLAMIIPFIISRFVFEIPGIIEKRKLSAMNVLRLLGLTAGFHSLIASGSRNGLLMALASSGVAAIWFCLINRKKHPRIIAAIAGSGLVITIILLSLKNFLLFRRLKNLMVHGDPIRISLWNSSIEAFKDSPFFGYGSGSFIPVFQKYVAPDFRFLAGTRSAHHAHSEYLELLTDSGGFGLLVYLIIWGWLVFQIFKRARGSEDHAVKSTFVGILTTIIAYHLFGLSSIATRYLSSKIFLFALIPALFADPGFKTGLPKLKMKFNVNYLLLALCPLILWNLLAGQYHFSKSVFLKNLDEVEIARLEKIFKSHGDPVGLFNIANAKFKIGNFNLIRNVHDVNEIIPDFRSVGFFKAFHYYAIGNYEDALKFGLEYLEKDQFHDLNNIMLFKLSAMKNDHVMAMEALRNVTKSTIKTVGLNRSHSHEDILITFDENPLALVCDFDSTSVSCNWSKQLITTFIDRLSKDKFFFKDADYFENFKKNFQKSLSLKPQIITPGDIEAQKVLLEFVKLEKTNQKKEIRKFQRQHPDIPLETYSKQNRFMNDILKTFRFLHKI